MGRKSSVMLDSTALVENRKRGLSGIGDVEEEDSVLPLQYAQQPAAAQDGSRVEFKWQWCGSLPMFPGGGSGTVLMTFP